MWRYRGYISRERNEKEYEKIAAIQVDISHPADLCFALVLVEGRGTQVAPPFKQHRIADELEPRSKFQAGLFKHGLQLVG